MWTTLCSKLLTLHRRYPQTRYANPTMPGNQNHQKHTYAMSLIQSGRAVAVNVSAMNRNIEADRAMRIKPTLIFFLADFITCPTS